jgi:hypothetical protein
VREEIDRMLEARIIEPIEESKWISPMVVQEKKKGGIRICVNLRKLNDAFQHDPFPTPFTDEVLENVGGREEYSFTDGFSGYHQIKIAPKEMYKTTFSKEWGSYQFLEVYLDYWTIYNLLKYHIEVLRILLERCKKFHISLNIKKCIFRTPF